MIAESQLRAVAPKADPQIWLDVLNAACARWDMNTPKREAAFLAQVAHESWGFTKLREDMNYSAIRLLEVFRRYFTPDSAAQFAHDEQRIANRVYANRMGNGSEASGDGYAFRGGGLIELTGRFMYRMAGFAVGVALEAQPARIAEPTIAAATAGWFFSTHGCNELADNDALAEMTHRIQGSSDPNLNGLADRVARYDAALNAA